jgi:Set1/Ash2 histone methyltransferase complex subunit ASH2
MTRSSFGVKEGSWYYEIEVLEHKGNTRLGWSTEKGDLQAPVGYDKYSFSYRDKEGTKFHQSRGASYGESYGPGDIIGFYIHLPPNAAANAVATLEEIKLSGKKDEEPNKLDGSEILFYKNGVSQGVAFSNIYEGRYFAAGSLYGGASVKFNFGPKFKYPPKDKEYRPFNELVEVVLAEPSDIKQQLSYNDISVNENGQLQVANQENKENADSTNIPTPMDAEISV